MFKKLYLIAIPLFYILVALTGSQFTSAGMEWYRTIHIPSWTPPGSFIGAVWTTIFTLTALSAILVWRTKIPKTIFLWIKLLFVANGFLNFTWSYLFFTKHLLTLAGFEAILLDLTVIALMALIWRYSRSAALLLLPYAAWTAFASFLTFTIASMNK
ncbi:MAG: TspO/MBR family protein [Patescibacteria group bacterium]